MRVQLVPFVALASFAAAGCMRGLEPQAHVQDDAGSSEAIAALDAGARLTAAEQGELCDGSDEIRLTFHSFGGGFATAYRHANPYGFQFLLVDGQCHYYASVGWMSGIVSGRLSRAQADDLLDQVGWSQRFAWQGYSVGTWADTTTLCVAAADAAFACNEEFECGAQPGKAEALRRAQQQLAALAQRGTPLSGRLLAFAFESVDPPTPPTLPWPLTRSIRSIDGLGSEDGVEFVLPKEVAALRTLRRTVWESSMLPLINSEDEGVFYYVLITDLLPEAVSQRYLAFTQRARASLETVGGDD
jgi:hypothetical protein